MFSFFKPLDADNLDVPLVCLEALDQRVSQHEEVFPTAGEKKRGAVSKEPCT